MADSEAKPKETHAMKKKKNKRKLSSLGEGTERPTKTHRVEQFDKHSEQIEVGQLAEELGQRELEEESPWRNLRLILSIQNKQLELHKLVISLWLSLCLFPRKSGEKNETWNSISQNFGFFFMGFENDKEKEVMAFAMAKLYFSLYV